MWTDGVVVLRPWRPADAETLVAAWSDREIARWTSVPADRSLAAATRWIAGWDERRRRGLALDLVVAPVAAEAAVMGEVGAAFVVRPASVGWWVLPAFRGQGVATRAVRLFVASVLAAGAVTELAADVDAGNQASIAVALAAGFEAADAALPGGRRYLTRPPAPLTRPPAPLTRPPAPLTRPDPSPM